ncbi:dimethyl sulfoxide reductase anchor subunit family protein [Vibrio gallicus]|uniref:dimethyl sulfoxide reductase anchor subunit family protein n=1 Tax=Vibrio gallicus TaxID=190897 RepID=UPI0021C3362B|nr:DmsC/YnfH family molybdoenzyme membrane anchor subunit [Vibrio gallicus]
MIYELPLVGFTVLAQTAVGAQIVLSLQQLNNNQPATRNLHIARFLVLAVMAIGFMCSTTHLGSPLRAFNAFNRVGPSALSNEILTGSSFLAIAGLAWLSALLNIGGRVVQKGLSLLSIVVGVVFMFAMAKVYLIPTVPAWFTSNTVIQFWFTVATLGLLFAATLVQVFGLGQECVLKTLAVIGIAFLSLHLASESLQVMLFGNIDTAIHHGMTQIAVLSGYVTVHVLLMALALLLWLVSAFVIEGKSSRSLLMCITLVVLLVAELAGRNVFYGMHFTAGLY